mmetsp:Transcript_3148/g.6166  ORF Transcript_3148/g.6166 Transcript_3148/m.6166 type:complete len:538 (-) Transcript_3148:381-1994(-)
MPGIPATAENKQPSAPAPIPLAQMEIGADEKKKGLKTGLVAAFVGRNSEETGESHMTIGEVKIQRVEDVLPPKSSPNFQIVDSDQDDAYLDALSKIGVQVIRAWSCGVGHRVLPGHIGLLTCKGAPQIAGVGQHMTQLNMTTTWHGTYALSEKIIEHENLTIVNVGSNEGAFMQDERHRIMPLGPGRYVMKEPCVLLTEVVSTMARDGAYGLKNGKMIEGELNGRAAFVKVPAGYVGLFRSGNTIGEQPPGEYVIYKQGVEFLGNANVQEYGKNLATIRVYTKDPTPVDVDVYVRVELHKPRILRGKTQYINLIDALEELVALKLKDTIGALSRNELQNPSEIPDYNGSSLADYLKAVSTAELAEFATSVGGTLLSIGFRVHYEGSYQKAMNEQAVATLKVETRLKNANAVARETGIIAVGKRDAVLAEEKGKIIAEVERVEKIAEAKAKAIRAIAEAEAKAIRTVAEAYKGLDAQAVQATVLERLAAQGVEKVKSISSKSTATFLPEGFSGVSPLDLAALKHLTQTEGKKGRPLFG